MAEHFNRALTVQIAVVCVWFMYDLMSSFCRQISVIVAPHLFTICRQQLDEEEAKDDQEEEAVTLKKSCQFR